MILSKLNPRDITRVGIREATRARSDLWIRWMNWRIGRTPLSGAQRPVIFFNASTRIKKISLNAAYSLVASWMVRLSGVPVIHFVCQAGDESLRTGNQTSRSSPGDALPGLYQTLPNPLFRHADASF